MNGTPTARWRGRATRTYTILGIARPGRLDVEEGAEFDIVEDHYGNKYAVVDGVEFSIQHIEHGDSDVEWLAGGLEARVAHLSGILNRVERPVEGELRTRLEAERAHAAEQLAAVTA